MLHHEPTAETDTQAAQVRVTAEEMAQAIAALEARKQQDAEQLAGTLSIGEAIDELHLDATPAELLAEVHAQRERDQARRATEMPPPPRIAPQPVPPQPTVSTGFALPPRPAAPKVHPAFGQRQAFRGQKWQGRQRPPKVVFFALFGLIPILFGHHSIHISTSDSPRIVTTAELKEGETAYTDLATVQELVKAQAADTVRVHTGDDLSDSWELVKHGDRLFLRGYTLPYSNEALQKGTFHLYNNDNAGDLEGKHDDSVTLPLDHLQIDQAHPGDDKEWDELTISHLKPDTHLREDW